MDRGLPLRGGDGIQVVQGIVQSVLGLVVPLDLYRAHGPDFFPVAAVGITQSAVVRALQRFAHRLSGVGAVPGGVYGTYGIQRDALTGLQIQAEVQSAIFPVHLGRERQQAFPTYCHRVPVILHRGNTQEGLGGDGIFKAQIMRAVDLPDIRFNFGDDLHLGIPVHGHGVGSQDQVLLPHVGRMGALEPGAGVALVKVAPQAGVFIARGEDGLGDLAVIRVEALFNDLPGVHLEVTVRIFSHFSFTP